VYYEIEIDNETRMDSFICAYFITIDKIHIGLSMRLWKVHQRIGADHSPYGEFIEEESEVSVE